MTLKLRILSLPSSILEVAVAHADIPKQDENRVPTLYLTNEVINAMKVDVLKKAIKSKGLQPKGKKTDSVQMLQDCVLQKIPISELPVANVDELS